MNFDFKEVLKIASGGGFAVLFILQVRELLKSIKELQEIQQKQVKNLQQIATLLNTKGKSQLNLIKLKPYYFQIQNKQISIRSAQKARFEPSDTKIINHFTKTLSKANPNSNKLQQIPCIWYASKTKKLPTDQNYQKIFGFGQIKADIFQIKRQFEPIKRLGYWTRFRNWFSNKFVKILPWSKNQVGTQTRTKPLLLGPVIGFLNYQINLMSNTQIVAVCNIQDGKIIPQITALSKNDIINCFKSIQSNNYFKVFGFLLATIVIGRWLWSDIKRMINALKVKRQKLSSSYFNPPVTDDKMCIICYTNCRNMVFFDCRHLIMCRECSETYESDVCPYCKLDIDEIKIINAVR